jgi:hypothetical protein
MSETDEPMFMYLDWKYLIGIPMRYISHIFLAKIENGELISQPPPSPYATVFIEAPELPNASIIQISHKIDFYNLWLLNEKGILDNEDVEVIIKHKPPTGMKKLMAAIFPHLEYSVFYRGYLDALYDPEERDLALETDPYIYLYDQERKVNVDDEES